MFISSEGRMCQLEIIGDWFNKNDMQNCVHPEFPNGKGL